MGQTDLLDRGEFVERLVQVAEMLSENKKTACYAINGDWGVGKSFVLDMFEDELRTRHVEDRKCIVFHYNCWQHDYYEEPLIAIISVLLEQIDEQINLVNREQCEKIKAVMKAVSITVLRQFQDTVKKKIGIDIKAILDCLETNKKLSEEQLKQLNAYDPMYALQKTLKKLSEELGELAEQQTVIMVVDELDRCLPEYAIKVLERLHHLFHEVQNTQVILAVDKMQLHNIVRQIYGEEISVDRYLKKFIQFEVELEVGETANLVKEAYPQYYQCFNAETPQAAEAEEIATTLLQGMDMRQRKVIVEKSYMIHCLLNEKRMGWKFTVLPVELFMTILWEYGLDVYKAGKEFNMDNLFPADRSAFAVDAGNLTGLTIMTELCRTVPETILEKDSMGRLYIKTEEIWGLLLWTYRTILGFVDETMKDMGPYRDYVVRYWNFLQTIS